MGVSALLTQASQTTSPFLTCQTGFISGHIILRSKPSAGMLCWRRMRVALERPATDEGGFGETGAALCTEPTHKFIYYNHVNFHQLALNRVVFSLIKNSREFHSR